MSEGYGVIFDEFDFYNVYSIKLSEFDFLAINKLIFLPNIIVDSFSMAALIFSVGYYSGPIFFYQIQRIWIVLVHSFLRSVHTFFDFFSPIRSQITLEVRVEKWVVVGHEPHFNRFLQFWPDLL